MSQVLIIASHPIPYIAPLFREMVAQGWSLQVAYCSGQGLEVYRDQEFGEAIAWDLPLLSGYPCQILANQSPWPGLGRFWGLCNGQLWAMVAAADVVICYTGYVYASFWIAALSAKWHRKGFIFSTDAHSLASRRSHPWKAKLKPWLLPWLYGVGDSILVSTRLAVEMVAGLGIERDRIFFTPSAADNDWWLAQSAQVDVAAVRQAWGIPLDGVVVVFCGKLQAWKRPQDLLAAFQGANVPNSYLLYIGNGPLREELMTLAQGDDRIRFLGFRNQTQLPAIYTAADLLCLCSDYEPFGVVVNEAMLCGCGAVVSDRAGSQELVEPGKNGAVYPCGDRSALTAVLADLLGDLPRLRQMGQAARARMASWSPRQNVASQGEAIARVLQKS